MNTPFDQERPIITPLSFPIIASEEMIISLYDGDNTFSKGYKSYSVNYLDVMKNHIEDKCAFPLFVVSLLFIKDID